MTSSTVVRPYDLERSAALRLAAGFAVANLLLTFALTLWTTHIGYSYFRDEFYYLACGRHLAWGYVDHGPIVALQARLGEVLFGESVFGIRVLSACAGAVMVFLGGMICWALGGHRSAQSLAMLGLMCTPQYIGVDGFLSMNSFEAAFWSACVLAVVMILRGSSPAKWWTILGVVAGIGLLNKPSMAFFLVAVALGLLVTPQRKILFTRWAALGIVLMLLIALPNVLWQIHYQWPTLKFLQNGKIHHKNITLGPVQFVLAQFSTMQPVNALIWMTGVVALLRGKSIRNSRWLGATMLFFYAIMFAAHAKDYYLEGIYPAFFAAGAIAWEHRFSASPRVRNERLIGFPILTAVLVITTLIVLPMASPVMAPAAWVRYTEAMHLPHDNTERSATGPLPQFYADRFGWEREVGIVKRTYDALSPGDRQRVCLFASNYGEAGAIDFFNRKDHLGLPPALSGQNSYWWWGMHGCDTNLVIAVIDDKPEEVATKYDSVTIVGQMYDPYSMPFEHRNIYLLRGRKPSAPFDWKDERFYI
ncbi:ArnT family glycosyltransferase [Bryocella elongata]|nr:glycosyltransferase family 39 protein [Bryocella elongata]